MIDPFTCYDPADVRDLIAQYPLAWLLASGRGAEESACLPLLGEYDDAGKLVTLLGHIPKRHPLCARLEAAPRALILFGGPQSYISPSQAGVLDWAPTWNFVQLSIEADVTFTADGTSHALATLTDAMERDRPDPWQIANLGARYEGLAARVIAFRARVHGVVGRFKLGQDERPEVRAAIIRSLGDHPLAGWMRRFDERLPKG